MLYAVAGGNAVAAWVAKVDDAGGPEYSGRRPADPAIRPAKCDYGHGGRRISCTVTRQGSTCSSTDPGTKPETRSTSFSPAKRFEPEYVEPAPRVDESESLPVGRVLALGSLVRMKLTSFRRKDQVHVQDMIGVSLIDASWCDRLPPVLADRLRELLADPDG